MQAFFDEVHAWTFEKGPFSQDRIATRLALRQAKRFVIDSDLAEHIDELIRSDERKLPEWTLLARLPFEHVWLEKASVEPFSVIKQGTLLSRVEGSACQWTASEFILNEDDLSLSLTDGVVLSLPSVFVVNTEGGRENPPSARGFPPIHELFPRLFPEKIDHVLWSPETKRRSPQQEDEPWFSDKVFMSTNHFWRKVFAEQERNPREGFEEAFYPMIKGAWVGFKTAIITLAVINDVPVTMTGVAPRGRRLHKGVSVPGLDHISVELKIAAKKPASWLRRRLNHSLIRKRAHEVRGHWRTYLDRRTGELKFKVWIEAHERGDRNLGFVEHSLAGGLLRAPKDRNRK